MLDPYDHYDACWFPLMSGSYPAPPPGWAAPQGPAGGATPAAPCWDFWKLIGRAPPLKQGKGINVILKSLFIIFIYVFFFISV